MCTLRLHLIVSVKYGRHDSFLPEAAMCATQIATTFVNKCVCAEKNDNDFILA